MVIHLRDCFSLVNKKDKKRKKSVEKERKA